MNRNELSVSVKNINLDTKLLQVDYLKCFICQSLKQKGSKTSTDHEELPRPTRQGYASLCRSFAGFIQCKSDSVPRHIELLFENLNQFEELMVTNNARYHKYCRDEYNVQKLERLEKRCKKMQVQDILHSDSGKVAEETVDETNTSNKPLSYDETYGSVFQEIVQLIELNRRSSEPEFYQLSQIAKTMSGSLDGFGFKNVTIHTSRLRDQLMTAIPGLRADKIGREILLSFDENVKHLVSSAIKNENSTKADILEAAMCILRETFIDKPQPVFSGSLNKNFCSENTVSKTLVTFISGILGNNAEDSEIAENIAQLIQFNSVKNRKPEASYVRHNVNREQPLPVYIALLIHSLTGKRSLIDELFDMGLCVSYSRVLDIERALASKVCEIYMKDDCVCPPHLKLGVFTTAAVDNIDHNPRSNSANYSFHGTGISLIQHYDQPNNDDYQQGIHLEKTDFSNKSKPSLPRTYYDITLLPTIDGEIPLSSVNWDSTLTSRKPLEYVNSWLENCSQLTNEDSDVKITSWSAYNSRLGVDISNNKSTSVMLPLIKDNINSQSVVRHTMDIVMSTMKKINPTQTPVWTGDQPVYAIGKQVQWLYPEQYGEDKIVLMLGGLHIEKSFLAVIGTWLEGSGWEQMVVKCGLTTSGRAEGILKSEHIKRARYAHEVSLAALNFLLCEQFENDENADLRNYFEWIESKRHQSAQFQYWITTMELQAILLQFIKSLRTGDFDEYVSVLESMCPWYLVTDHTHYGRWLPVFVANMKQLPTTNPQVYEQFKKGHFTSRQTNRKFSCISDDQLHEQNNKLVKESSSLLGMLNDESSIVKWMVSGPEISRLIWEYKNLSSNNTEDLKHHEDSKWFQSKFSHDVQNMVKEMRNKGPFCTTELSTIGHERKLMNDESTKNVMAASGLGSTKYLNFVSDRLISTKDSIHLTIKQTQLIIFKVKTEKKVNKEKMKLAAANTDSNLFCKLFIASGVRKGDVSDFFMHENNRYPPSLSDFGSLRKSAINDDMVNCLLKSQKTNQSSRSVRDSTEAATVLIMNALSHVNIAIPVTGMTVKDYSEQVFNKIIDGKREKYVRVDVLFDVNNENSLEEMTREVCNEEKYVSWIDNETKLQNGTVWFTKFLSKTKTKTQFLKILARNYVQSTPNNNGNVFGTQDHIVISSNETVDTNYRLSIENINARMLLHVENAVRNGHQQIVLSTSDYNIVNVAIYAFKYLAPSLKKLWIEVVDVKQIRQIAIHELYDVHKDKSDVLPFFNAFTGCSTTSFFFGIGKTTAWNAWLKFPSVSSAMLQLLKDGTPNFSNEAMNVIEEYTIKMYDSSSKMTKLHDCRRDLFTRKNKPRTIDRIPPTRDALEQHVKRSILQSTVWTQCLRENIRNLEPADWGWQKQEESNKYTPVWVSIPIVAEYCRELISCKCPNQCTGRCNCLKNQLPCTMLCACDGNCRELPK